MMKKTLVDEVKFRKSYFVNIDSMCRWFTTRIGYLDVENQERKFGNSGYNALNLTNIVRKIIIAYTALPFKYLLYNLMTYLIFVTFLALNITTNLGEIQFSIYLVFGGLFILVSSFIFAYFYHITSILSNKPAYFVLEKF